MKTLRAVDAMAVIFNETVVVGAGVVSSYLEGYARTLSFVAQVVA